MGKADKIRRKEARAELRSKGQFYPLPYNLLKSPAFRSLSLAGYKTLFYLITLYNGKNNGKIELSQRDAAIESGLSLASINKALSELEEKGFIVCRQKARFTMRAHERSLYSLTTERVDGKPRLDLWKQWNKPPIKGKNQEVKSCKFS